MRSAPSSHGRSAVTLLPPDIRFNIFAVALLLAGLALGWVVAAQQRQPLWIVAGTALGATCALSPRVPNQIIPGPLQDAMSREAQDMLDEGLKEKGALMLIPSSAVESMGMGGLMGAAALAQQQLTTKGEAPSS